MIVVWYMSEDMNEYKYLLAERVKVKYEYGIVDIKNGYVFLDWETMTIQFGEGSTNILTLSEEKILELQIKGSNFNFKVGRMNENCEGIYRCILKEICHQRASKLKFEGNYKSSGEIKNFI